MIANSVKAPDESFIYGRVLFLFWMFFGCFFLMVLILIKNSLHPASVIAPGAGPGVKGGGGSGVCAQGRRPEHIAAQGETSPSTNPNQIQSGNGRMLRHSRGYRTCSRIVRCVQSMTRAVPFSRNLSTPRWRTRVRMTPP